MRRLSIHFSLFVVLCASLTSGQAQAFILSSVGPDPWLTTASGPRTGNGAPATITWSIVPDSTTMSSGTGFGTAPSNLIAFMNSNFGGNPAQADLTQQPWFHLFEDSFDRWSELGGVTYVFEPNDDGVFHPSSGGVLGVRGDIRIGGFNIDGPSSTLAFTYVPTAGSDMAIDTGDISFYTNAAEDHLNFRNTLMHEIGHSFGLLHINSSSSLLMAPIIDTSFDGPQLDEVRGVEFFFGDTNEKSNNGLGNGTPALATSLGVVPDGITVTVGAAADVPSQALSPAATDFVSISNAADVDFYSFTVSQPSLLEATLTPRGGVFTQASPGEMPTSFNANARNNLALAILDDNGASVHATADANPSGEVESIAGIMLSTAGTYYARVTGVDDTIQLYDLSLSIAELLLGDYNVNGVVDAADYIVWRDRTPGPGILLNDATPGTVSSADYDVWRRNFGRSNGSTSSQTALPEPISAMPFVAGLIFAGFILRRLPASGHMRRG